MKQIAVAFLKRMLKLGVRCNAPAVSAAALAGLARNVNATGEYRVLVLGRSIFNEDVEAIAACGKRIAFVRLFNSYFKLIFHQFVDSGISDSAYHHDSTCDEGKRLYYRHLSSMVPHLQRLVGFQAVLSGNFGYAFQQELARVCEEKRIPFVVLHKEGIVVPEKYGEFGLYYKKHRFIGARLLLYNERMRQTLFDIELPGMTEENTCVVGVPRLDQYVQPPPTHADTVVFFSFYPKDKFQYYVRDREMLATIEQRSVAFHRLLLDFARKHTQMNVIIKTKVSRFSYVQGIYDAYPHKPITNVVLTNSIPAAELIKKSRAVIGLSSTTLIEALLAGRRIISPLMQDILPDMPFDYFSRFPLLVTYVQSMDDLEEAVFKPAVRDDAAFQSEREALLREMIFIPDGRASARAEQAIVDAIIEYQRNPKTSMKKHGIEGG